MLSCILLFFRSLDFPVDEVKNHRTRALNAIQVNMGGYNLYDGGISVLFFFAEKFITSLALLTALHFLLHEASPGSS